MLVGEFTSFQESGVGARSGQGLLEPQAEARLWQRWRQNQDESARATILESYLPYCRHLAIEYARRSNVPVQDLFGEAQLEMTRQFPRYDPEKVEGARFVHFIEKHMRGKLLDYISRNASPVRLSTTKAQDHLFRNWGRLNREVLLNNPDMIDYTRHQQIAKLAAQKHTSIKTETVAAFEARLHSSYLSLNRSLTDGDPESQEFIDNVIDEDSSIAALENTEYETRRKQDMQTALSALPARDREIIESRYLCADEKKLTLHDLAAKFNVSCERIRQLEVRSLRTLRAQLPAQYAFD